MRYSSSVLSAAIILIVPCFVTTLSARIRSRPVPEEVVSPPANAGLRGDYFVQNQGQWRDQSVYFALRSHGINVAFRESCFTVHLFALAGGRPDAVDESDGTERDGSAEPRERSGSSGVSDEAELTRAGESQTLTVTFAGANPVVPRGSRPQAARFNYFVGGESRAIASQVPSFDTVIYEDLYDGIDLHIVGGDDGVLKYEFRCDPGAEWSQIRIQYDGINALRISDTGDLEIATALGTLRDDAPVVWQDEGGERRYIPSRFELTSDRSYRIALDGEVDSSRVLVMDPEIRWVYFIGGSDSDYLTDLAIDSAGNSILTGYTYSTDFVGHNNTYHGRGHFEAFVAKVDPTGEVLWTTYLGGSESDSGRQVDVRGDGSIIASGETRSTDLERSTNAYHGRGDCFVASIDPSGQLEWTTYLGGTGLDSEAALSAGPNGMALIAGQTDSLDWQGASNTYYGGSSDAFLVSVDRTGATRWMMYLGGTEFEEARSVAVDSNSNIIVSGRTDSEDFSGRVNSRRGSKDAFVSKLDSEGEVIWMRYLGGINGVDESGRAVCVDPDDNVVLAGYTYSTDFEGRINSYHGGVCDAFALKLSPASDLLWMVYLGGTHLDDAESVAVAEGGRILVAGTTLSRDFEGQSNFYRGQMDGFVVQLEAGGTVLWMNYLGGSEREGSANVAFDGPDIACIAGSTQSNNFPGHRNGMYDSYDAFLAKMALSVDPDLVAETSCPDAGPAEIRWRGASSNGRVVLLFARSTTLPITIPRGHPCAGAALDLGPEQFQTVLLGRSDGAGAGSVRRLAGSFACGGFLQLVDLDNCATSTVALLE